MPEQDRAFVIEQCREHRVKFIRLWFTDILGMLKSFSLTIDELPRVLEEGMGFDGSSIEGFARIEESDRIAMPDPNTFALLPWRSTESGGVARMFCDILLPDGEPYPADPRHILQRNLRDAAAMGLTFYVAPELEYFYFKSAKGTPEPLDEGGYFDLTPLDAASDLRKETILLLDQMGIETEHSHHEVAPSQHEIDLRYCDALTMADNTMTYRLLVKQVAVQHGVHATFMPKPIGSVNGSGMHVHQSLFRGETNTFFAAADPYQLSAVGRHYLAGLLAHCPEITAVTNQWVNSYKRLVPGYEAPAFVCWGRKNRSALVRVPEIKTGRESSARVELRSPDPAANPYLAFAVMLAAGLEGIRTKREPPAPVEIDVNKLSPAEARERGIAQLPASLDEAIQRLEGSELVRRALGEPCFERFVANKKIEWDNYRVQVSAYELDRYLAIL
jgi:glutamine synthetase